MLSSAALCLVADSSYQSNYGRHFWVVQGMMQNPGICTCPLLAAGILPPATGDDVFHRVDASKTPGNVSTQGPKNSIDCEPEMPNEEREVEEEMEFWFGYENARAAFGQGESDISTLQVPLTAAAKIEITAACGNTAATCHTAAVSRLNCRTHCRM
ncbi:hypothetical protein DFH09DRAFT_1093533 [Mycena vulgaris]|nr:hypothetical protein DFH09DRAFT_1093533 [Mycena vulgaris]